MNVQGIKRLVSSLLVFALSVVLSTLAVMMEHSSAVIAVSYVAQLLMAIGGFGVAYVAVLNLSQRIRAHEVEDFWQTFAIYALRIFAAIGILMVVLPS